MTHEFIPTLPQIRPIYRAKSHRAIMPTIIDPRIASGEMDQPSQARCTGVTPMGLKCLATLCPRHFPGEYADMMASHATDSIR